MEENVIHILYYDKEGKQIENMKRLIAGAGFVPVQAAEENQLFQGVSENPQVKAVFLAGSDATEQLERLRRIRNLSDIPVLLLVDSYEESEQFVCAGADDCLMWPVQEVIFKIKTIALIRRWVHHNQEKFQALLYGDLLIDKVKNCYCKGMRLHLSKQELGLLLLLLASKETPLPVSQILEEVWAEEQDEITAKEVNNLVRRLRKKLENGGSYVRVEAIHKSGYRLQMTAVSADR